MATTITYEDAKRTLLELAAERPDYIYERPVPPPDVQAEYDRIGFKPPCRYSDFEGEPSCIVGHVLYRITPNAFGRLAAWEKMMEKSTLPEHALSIAGVEVDNQTLQLLSHTQYAQDAGGHTWDEAVANGIAKTEWGS